MTSDDGPTTELGTSAGTETSPVLVVLAATGVTHHPLPRAGRVVVGRAPEADVVIADASVSRRHAAIEPGDDPIVEDLGSANGTLVGGARLEGRARFRFGEAIQIGSATVVLLRDRRAATAEIRADGPVFVDPRTLAVTRVIERVASGRLGVLLLGETGSGKEVFAELIHRRSPRASGPFVRINCAALPEGLFEAELFGHERGAFTGAVGVRRGLIEEASGGTLFLDEIGDLPLGGQAKLLRALEERAVRRIGGRAPVPVDVRLVAATHRELRDDASTFRRDLYYRLAGLVVSVPPLRERPLDIEPLAEHFLARAALAAARPPLSLTPTARAWLRGQRWPGNVRELRNACERALLLTDGATVEVEHLAGEPDRAEPPAEPSLRDVVGEVERARILAVLEDCAWNQSEAARRLGISRNTLAARIRAFRLRG